ncbi:MAG: heavy metal translocating P-type ATPase [Campylobacteraceae bacterium]|jgi:Cu+-exporting ATPase|nr:heavy metal translocating P-type ATPase [Campylobacteraceae bacterium]
MPKMRCDHCGLTYDEELLLKDTAFTPPKNFCCKGCQGIFHLLSSEGLSSFYDKKGRTSLEPPKTSGGDLERFDMDGFKEKYVKEKDGFCEVSLIISGIHCAACVWLNEKILHKMEGVIEASISQANNKAKILWDPETTSLSHIIEAIRSIGYNAFPYDPKIQESQANAARREYYSRLVFGIFAVMNIMWIAIAQYYGYFFGIEKNVKQVLTFAEFLLATPTLFFTGSIFFRGAYYGLKNGFVTMDLLIASGSSLTYIYSVYVMLSGIGEPYFDSVTMIVTFVFAGKFLEVLMRKKAVDTLDTISSMLPSEVLVIKDGEKEYVNVENVQIGDLIELRASEKVVIDGVCESGEGSFDESSLSGESIPVLKIKGDKITSGTVCLDSVLTYRACLRAQDSTVSKIATLLEDAMSKKPHIEQLANKISRKFSSTILFIAFITLLCWWYNTDFNQALIVAISVIVIACPCALGLATPVSTLVGLGVGAKKGVLFKESIFLEAMAKCDVLALDKTGTITLGKPEVVKVEKYDDFDISLLFSLVKSSLHPVSIGVAKYLEKEPVKELKLENVKTLEAKGVEAMYGKTRLLGGNARLMKEFGFECEEGEATDFWFAADGALKARFTLKDMPRKDAKETISKIKSMGIEVVMLTGDNARAAKDTAQLVGIESYHHSLLPQDKADFIENLKKSGKKVVMAGDGINDTLALAKSDIALSLGSGTDIAVGVSDVVLMNDSLKALGLAFELSRKTYRTVKQNIAFSILYNATTIPLAAAGFVMPLIAALSMSFSSLVVVANALRIKLKGRK